TQDGKNISIDELKGKVVLVDFFATWCPPCRAEIPHLVNLQTKYKDNFSIVAVLVEEDKKVEDVKDFINEYKINYSVTVGEPNFELSKMVGGVRSLPFMIMYDKNGKYVTHYIGAVPEEMIEYDIKRAIEGK
ncbi:MAG: TlpA family protein disulfide reductase, partial [Campylobacterales bacterium]|nr:TlpA family protein disulfide reductase [Campylobacterales bacterium]